MSWIPTLKWIKEAICYKQLNMCTPGMKATTPLLG